jgi:hypothetical protein
LCVNQPTAGNTIYNTTRRVAIKICILEGSITDLALHSGGGNSSHDVSNWTPIPESQIPRDCPQKTGWYQFLADGSWASNSVGHCVGLAFINYNRVRILTTEPMYYPSNKLIPFTGYQRSATQGLLPIVGNSTIDLSNVSFDSNAQIVFDGTDDVITVSMTNLRPATQITQEVVVYIDTNTTQVWIGSQYGTSSNNSYALWLNSANSLYGGVNIDGSFNNQGVTYPITTNMWYHFVHTYDGTAQRLYANGVEVHSWSTSGTIAYDTNNTLLAIGNDWNGPGYNSGASLATHGKQDITKIYNRALSAAEIRQNYNKYKTRFNLP